MHGGTIFELEGLHRRSEAAVTCQHRGHVWLCLSVIPDGVLLNSSVSELRLRISTSRQGGLYPPREHDGDGTGLRWIMM